MFCPPSSCARLPFSSFLLIWEHKERRLCLVPPLAALSCRFALVRLVCASQICCLSVEWQHFQSRSSFSTAPFAPVLYSLSYSASLTFLFLLFELTKRVQRDGESAAALLACGTLHQQLSYNKWPLFTSVLLISCQNAVEQLLNKCFLKEESSYPHVSFHSPLTQRQWVRVAAE